MNAEYIQEPERTLPVRYADYDVIVAGGGIAGIAAALAAARAGKRVLLLERMFALGGLATLGLVTIYLPLCDGKGHQLSFGLARGAAEAFHPGRLGAGLPRYMAVREYRAWPAAL